MPSHSGTSWLEITFPVRRYADSRKIHPSIPQEGMGESG